MPVVTRPGFYDGVFKKPGQTAPEAAFTEVITAPEDDLREAVADALMEIGPEAGGDGVPNLDVVREAVVASGHLSASQARKRITAKLRDAVWAELRE